MTKRPKTWAVAGVAFLFGAAAAQLLPPLYGQAPAIKGPKWQYGLGLQVRKGTEDNFTKETKKYGVEVFRDENTGNLIYISESGSIAVVPGK
jgi:hypothetical protein